MNLTFGKLQKNVVLIFYGILNFGSLCLGKTSFKWIPHWMSDHLSRQPFKSKERIARVVLLAMFSRFTEKKIHDSFDFSAFLTSQVCFRWEITTLWIQKIARFFLRNASCLNIMSLPFPYDWTLHNSICHSFCPDLGLKYHMKI
jgi:hypothetical protein